jgi:hypothetical protein
MALCACQLWMGNVVSGRECNCVCATAYTAVNCLASVGFSAESTRVFIAVEFRLHGSISDFMQILNYISQALNEGHFCISVSLDLKKAFEVCDHKILLKTFILGPILFLCYINDFYAATNLFPGLFADDTTGLGKGKNLNELTEYVNNELQKKFDRTKWQLPVIMQKQKL